MATTRRSLLAWASASPWLAARFPRRASYFPLLPHELVLRADMIVAGSIHAVRPSTFVIDVDDWIVGPTESVDRLEVWRFEDWVCAARWMPYGAGQRSVFHLQGPEPPRTEHPFAAWPHPRGLGAGNEGECPLFDGGRQLLHPEFPSRIQRGHEWQESGACTERVRLPGRELWGARIDLVTYGRAARGLRDLFRWEAPTEGRRATIVSSASEERILAYARESWLALALARWAYRDDAFRWEPAAADDAR